MPDPLFKLPPAGPHPGAPERTGPPTFMNQLADMLAASVGIKDPIYDPNATLGAGLGAIIGAVAGAPARTVRASQALLANGRNAPRHIEDAFRSLEWPVQTRFSGPRGSLERLGRVTEIDPRSQQAIDAERYMARTFLDDANEDARELLAQKVVRLDDLKDLAGEAQWAQGVLKAQKRPTLRINPFLDEYGAEAMQSGWSPDPTTIRTVKRK